MNNISGIKVPGLIIHSKNDPITPLSCVPLEELEKNENIITAIVRGGGHCSYFTGLTGRKRWYPLVTGEYFDAIIEMNELKKK